MPRLAYSPGPRSRIQLTRIRHIRDSHDTFCCCVAHPDSRIRSAIWERIFILRFASIGQSPVSTFWSTAQQRGDQAATEGRRKVDRFVMRHTTALIHNAVHRLEYPIACQDVFRREKILPFRTGGALIPGPEMSTDTRANSVSPGKSVSLRP